MSILYPLGLLAIIGIPVLVFIYIIKNRFTEKTIASTYLWTLSEKFLKRRIPISRINGIISLILQCLAVGLLALAITQPILTIPNSAKAYCFILDGSGSMNMSMKDSTRFEIGKDRIAEIIDDSMKGSTYTLIYAGNSTETIFKNVSDKYRATQILNNLSVSYTATPLTDALQTAQKYFYENPSVKTYLITDKDYQQHDNIEIIKVFSEVDNYFVTDVKYDYIANGLKVSGTAASYAGNVTLTVELYFDGLETAYDTQTINLMQSAQTTAESSDGTYSNASFEFVCEGVNDFASLRVVIPEKDALSDDNEVIIYNVSYENMSKTLLVSDYPFYVEAALRAAGNSQVEVISPDEYKPASGYGLYIFDEFTPEALPKDGAVWFISPQKSLAGTNFSFQSSEIVPMEKVKYSTSTSTRVGNLLHGVSKTDFDLLYYVKCGLAGNFTTLMTCDGNPLLFVGYNTYGQREVVFAFDPKDSAPFILSTDYTLLVSNLLNYSFPSVIENTSFYCGETLEINVISGCDSIKIETPLGKESYPDMSEAICEYELTEVGTYKIILTMTDRSVSEYNVYSSLPKEECIPLVKEYAFSIIGEAGDDKFDGIYDDLLILFIVLALIAAADYGVYCYEQYQLR